MSQMALDLERFLQEEISSGRFADREAVIAYAVRLLQADREEAILGIQAGLDDVAAGRTQPLAQAFDQLRREHNAKAL